ncbi:hypothetical protein [Cellulophaga sp. L1A9]|uniref:hypothetical protein n=1 Tax=Cellulophaga sp. L1A9 TaxID=2686362 RepID=UPI00131B241D|nr:hypothetical protein [Cellulophaga sp. L1A9]
MNRFKKIIKYLSLLILLLILSRGVLFRTLVKYSEVDRRKNSVLTDKNLIAEINYQTEGKVLNIEEIIALSNEITSDTLAFSLNKVSSNANSVYTSKKANCIGYSSLFNSVGNYILAEQKLTDSYEFIHLVGALNVLGFNIHNLFDNPFFKDHDYNEIKYKKMNTKLFVDPSLWDYLRIEYVSSQKNSLE